jgi:hypothetical protein
MQAAAHYANSAELIEWHQFAVFAEVRVVRGSIA